MDCTVQSANLFNKYVCAFSVFAEVWWSPQKKTGQFEAIQENSLGNLSDNELEVKEQQCGPCFP